MVVDALLALAVYKGRRSRTTKAAPARALMLRKPMSKGSLMTPARRRAIEIRIASLERQRAEIADEMKKAVATLKEAIDNKPARACVALVLSQLR
jgi:hypothetical protein